jgi:hypothetical protein
MKNLLFASCAMLLGCGGSLGRQASSLERVVVYRNGVAYFERAARVTGDSLTVRVRSGDVDDFLKSLSVVDGGTRASIPVEYPSGGRSSDGDLVEMKIRLPGSAPHDVRLSYVVEAPAWKPTYRAVIGDKGKLTLEGMAIVDNASDEDWDGVKLAVAASAALSFRFDLKTVRFMQRETFAAGAPVAPAPPPGGVPYGGEVLPAAPRVIGEVSAEALDLALAPADKLAWARDALAVMAQLRGQVARQVSIARDQRDVVRLLCENDKLSQLDVAIRSAREREAALAAAVQAGDGATATHEATVIQGLAKRAHALEAESWQCVGEEAAFAGDTQVNVTVDPGLGGDEDDGFGVPSPKAPPPPAPSAPPPPRITAPAPAPTPRKPPSIVSTEPVGSGHFEASSTASIPSGASAMVSVFKQEAAGDLVYLYDRESSHGNDTYAFLALRFTNPTSEALEGGPFTVLGQGRLLGEGIAEGIPGGGVAFVPFALDRQIVVTRSVTEKDEIARVLGLDQGLVSAAVTRVRTTRLSLHNRLSEPATVYVRHTLAKDAALREAPKEHERLGAAELFRVEVPAGGDAEVVVEEGTPAEKSVDPTSKEGAALVRAFVASKGADLAMKEALGKLLAAADALDEVEGRLRAARAAKAGHEERKADLAQQIATLRGSTSASRTLLAELERKLAEADGRVVAAAVEIVALEEKRQSARALRDRARSAR